MNQVQFALLRVLLGITQHIITATGWAQRRKRIQMIEGSGETWIVTQRRKKFYSNKIGTEMNLNGTPTVID